MASTPQQIIREVEARARKGLKAATIWVASKVKEIISVPAPRVMVKPKFGAPYYRATTKATPGAPPRKLSGELRRSVAWEMRNNETVGRIGTNKVYGRSLEEQGHTYLTLAIQIYGNEIQTIMGRAFYRGGNV